MFTDTITISINSVDKTLNRINQDAYSSEYYLAEDTGEFRLRLRNTRYTKKTSGVRVDRHNVELIHEIYGATPDIPSTERKFYSVFERENGDELATMTDFVVGIVAFHTEGNIVKLLNRES